MGRGLSHKSKEKLACDNIEKIRKILLGNREFRSFDEGVASYGANKPPYWVDDSYKGFSQMDIIHSILMGNDTIAVLPTGGGKSVCFQGPALCCKGITIVISPLVALIEDQVHNFNREQKRNGSKYRAIYPGMKGLSSSELFKEITRHCSDEDNNYECYKLLYLSPEKLSSPKFMHAFKRFEQSGKINIDLIVIDEVHCMSQWGLAFREDYLNIGNFIDSLKRRPVIAAFSATVTEIDIAQFSKILKFTQNTSRFICYSIRENLNVHIVEVPLMKKPLPLTNKKTFFPTPRYIKLKEILSKNKDRPCIIYCTTTETADKLHKAFYTGYFKSLNLKPAKYHGKLALEERKQAIKNFMPSTSTRGRKSKHKTNVMIATKAFGMGIDRSDISLIIHYDISKSIEDYYQEIGRAGRNPEIQADCYLLYDKTINVRKTINWVTEESVARKLSSGAITGWFSEKYRKMISYCYHYRLASMIEMCNCFTEKEDDDFQEDEINIQEYIIDYFKNSMMMDSMIMADYIEQVPKSKYEDDDNNEESFDGKKKIVSKKPRLLTYNIKKNKTEDFYKLKNNDADPNPIITEGFREYYKGIPEAISNSILDFSEKSGAYDELTATHKRVNILHVNNTKVANHIRNGGEYNYGEPMKLLIKEWRRDTAKISPYGNKLPTPVNISETTALIGKFRKDFVFEKEILPEWNGLSDEEKDFAKIMFIVNLADKNTIMEIRRLVDNKWQIIDDDDDLRVFKGLMASRLLPVTKYPDWHKGNRFEFIEGARSRVVTFTIEAVEPHTEKLTYFDMCVLDAIYSVMMTESTTIYVKTIWEILSGDRKNDFSRSDSRIKTAIESSIEKMRSLLITIEDPNCYKQIIREPFLKIFPKGENHKGYICDKNIPPLFAYAEQINGEIVNLPVSLMNIGNVIRENDEKLDIKNAGSFRATIDNAVLMHYLLHRIAVANKRMKYIDFDTIRGIAEPYMSKRELAKKETLINKVLLIIGYLNYIKYTSAVFYKRNYRFVIEYLPKEEKEKEKKSKDKEKNENQENKLKKLSTPNIAQFKFFRRWYICYSSPYSAKKLKELTGTANLNKILSDENINKINSVIENITDNDGILIL